MLSHFSLFAGIGGIDIAAEWAGFTTVAQCEIADYPTKVLEKHWPDVPRWRDIREITKGGFYERTGLQTVDLISGGFPCQPFSVAGKRKGKKDDRDLWPEMFRVIQELMPRWVLGENVANFVNMELERTILDLEGEGYETITFNIPACAVGAPHKRSRVFIVAYTNSKGQSPRRCREPARRKVACRYDATNTDSTRCEKFDSSAKPEKAKLYSRSIVKKRRNWATEPDVGRVAHGVSNRVDRLKCLGNAVVPQQIYPILKAIFDIEKGGGKHLCLV